jgi:hypothetical protein
MEMVGKKSVINGQNWCLTGKNGIGQACLGNFFYICA